MGRRKEHWGRRRPETVCENGACHAPIDGEHREGCEVQHTFRLCQECARNLMARDHELGLLIRPPGAGPDPEAFHIAAAAGATLDAQRFQRALAQALAALRIAQPLVCSLRCPSAKNHAGPWPHSAECRAVTAALASESEESRPEPEEFTNGTLETFFRARADAARYLFGQGRSNVMIARDLSITSSHVAKILGEGA